MTDLRDCPFCGAPKVPPAVEDEVPVVRVTDGIAYVKCLNCGAMGPPEYPQGNQTANDVEDGAVINWNERWEAT
jgi:transcription elongation factor Elf1